MIEAETLVDDQGQVNVTVSDGSGGGPNATPVITDQPIAQTVDVLQPLYLAVTASAFPPPSYQWKRDGVTISGETGPVFYRELSLPADDGDYTVDITSGSTVTSVGATITINGDAYAPIITTQPTDQQVNEGSNVALSVVVDAEPEASYQWQKNGSSINNATNSSLTLNNTDAGDEADYRVIVTNVVGSTISAEVFVDVNTRPILTLPNAVYGTVGELSSITGTSTMTPNLCPLRSHGLNCQVRERLPLRTLLLSPLNLQPIQQAPILFNASHQIAFSIPAGL